MFRDNVADAVTVGPGLGVAPRDYVKAAPLATIFHYFVSQNVAALRPICETFNNGIPPGSLRGRKELKFYLFCADLLLLPLWIGKILNLKMKNF